MRWLPIMIKKGPCNRAGLSGLGVPRVGGRIYAKTDPELLRGGGIS